MTNTLRVYRDGDYLVTEYVDGRIERRLDVVDQPSVPPPPLATLTLAAAHDTVGVGQPVIITADLDVPLSAPFAVPIEDATGAVAMIKAVVFEAGHAEVELVFARSGYYRLTEAGINRKLPPDQRIALPADFELTVYE